MPVSKRRKNLTSKPANVKSSQKFMVCYTQSEDDDDILNELGRIASEEYKAAGKWPDPLDESELGKMKIGRAVRQISEIVEERFYQAIKIWLKKHPQFRTSEIHSRENGYQVTITFTSKIGQDAFLKAFPAWTKEPRSAWYDGLPEGESVYDLPDNFSGNDGQHRQISKDFRIK